jgi:phosphatidylglycerol:prolipoprotein diacylglycerol transferase
MYPELFRIGSFSLHSYGVLMALAFAVAGLVMYWRLGRAGADPFLAFDFLIAAIVGGVVGAKIHYLLVHPEHFPQAVLSGQGLIWYGGLVGGTLLVVLVALWRRYPVRSVADVVAPALAAGYAVGRVGCFLNGCCYGQSCSLPWGVAFPFGEPPTAELVHPTQLYESFGSLGIFLVLVFVLAPRLYPRGALFFSYLVMAGAARFLVEFLRTNPGVVMGFTQQQVISAVVMAVGIGGLLWVFHSQGGTVEPVPLNGAGSDCRA